VTLDRLAAGQTVEYLPTAGLGAFDLVLSYAGGPALDALRSGLGARQAAPLYGCVDVDQYPAPSAVPWAAVSYLGTYADDRAQPFQSLFLDAAARLPQELFLAGGPNYPGVSDWPANVRYRPHVAQGDHRDFYGSARFTLNLTRGPMRRWGHCPSARLFEASALGVPLMTDDWPGLEDFFTPNVDVALVRTSDDVVAWASRPADDRARLAARARERVLDTCSAAVRARELERLLAMDVSASTTAPSAVRVHG
jgi:spore maturation protein CgeB